MRRRGKKIELAVQDGVTERERFVEALCEWSGRCLRARRSKGKRTRGGPCVAENSNLPEKVWNDGKCADGERDQGRRRSTEPEARRQGVQQPPSRLVVRRTCRMGAGYRHSGKGYIDHPRKEGTGLVG